MFAAVTPIYLYGVMRRQPPVIGQVFSERIKGVMVLNLWPVDFVESSRPNYKPVAVLWQPVFAGATFESFIVRGLEVQQQGQERRWCVQKWICEIMSSNVARDRLNPIRPHEVAPARS